MPADETPTPERPEVPENLDDLTPEQLAALDAQVRAYHEAIAAEAATEGTPFARIREIRDDAVQAQAESARLVAAQTERISVANDLGSLELPEFPAAPEPPAAEVVETPAETEPVTEPEPVTAGLTVDEITNVRDVQDPPPDPQRHTTPLSVVAGLSESSVMTDDGQVDYEAMARLLTAEKGKLREPGATVKLASIIPFEADPNVAGHGLPVLSDQNSARFNDRIARDAVEQWRQEWDDAMGAPSRTAAICTPYDIIRDIPNAVQSSEPLSDSLPSVGAGRLGFQITPPMVLADVAAGVTIWADADQASVSATDQGTWKPCVAVTCPTPTTVVAEAIPACLYFDITTDMSNPERVRDAMGVIRGQKARVKTGRLLQIIDTLSYHYEATTPYGALPGMVQTILTTLEQGEYPNRLADDEPYILYTPPGLLSALVIDRENQPNLDVAERTAIAAELESILRDAGKNVRVIDLDDVERSGQTPFASLPSVGAPGKVALPGLGGTTRPFKARLVAPQAALYFSTGEIETGVTRSPDLYRRNQAQWFMEEFVGLTKHGPQPWYTLHLSVCPTGTRAALTTPFSCSTSAS